jgi:hypothetical protein
MKSPLCMDDVVLMVTNGGPHPADRWASLAAGQVANLISVDENSNSPAAASARKSKPQFALNCANALESVFVDAMSDAEAAVNNGSITVRHAPIDVEPYFNSVESAVISSAGGTQFAGQFSSQSAREAVDKVVGQYLADAINISRSWALDAKGL